MTAVLLSAPIDKPRRHDPYGPVVFHKPQVQPTQQLEASPPSSIDALVPQQEAHVTFAFKRPTGNEDGDIHLVVTT
ncbi:Hypothetical protein, putative, partial [Bodo saltans]